ncbi:MAG: TlpA disulfide reductase family protein [Acidobacteriota bacterium]
MKFLIIIAIVFTFSLSLCAQQQAQMLKNGDAAPVFSGQKMDGTPYDLSQLQGKVVVLTFWSTRCAICHSEIPKLNQVVDRYRDKDVVFVAATMDSEPKIQAYLKKTPFNFTIMPNAFGMMLQYADKDRSGNINMGFPAHFVINRQGAIAMRADGWDKTDDLDSKIRALLSME